MGKSSQSYLSSLSLALGYHLSYHLLCRWGSPVMFWVSWAIICIFRLTVNGLISKPQGGSWKGNGIFSNSSFYIHWKMCLWMNFSDWNIFSKAPEALLVPENSPGNWKKGEKQDHIVCAELLTNVGSWDQIHTLGKSWRKKSWEIP